MARFCQRGSEPSGSIKTETSSIENLRVRMRQQGPPISRYPTPSLLGVTTERRPESYRRENLKRPVIFIISRNK